MLYRCNICKINMCPLCKIKHDKNHNIINYELKDYICIDHNEGFIEYCIECKKIYAYYVKIIILSIKQYFIKI